MRLLVVADAATLISDYRYEGLLRQRLCSARLWEFVIDGNDGAWLGRVKDFLTQRRAVFTL